MENKRKNVYIVIFAITTIVAACIAIYFGIMYQNVKVEMEGSKASIEELKNSIAKMEEKDNTVVSEQVKEETSEVKEVKYDPNRIKNPITDRKVVYGDIMDSADISGISKIHDGLNASLDSQGVINITKNNRDVKVIGIDEKITKIFYGTVGQGALAYIVALSENGNVYVSDDIFYALTSYNAKDNYQLNFRKRDKFSNIYDIVRVDSTIYGKFEGMDMSTANVTFIGIDKNGDCYDLFN